MTTALITGATGFIGSWLVDELIKRNYRIKCIVRNTSNLRWLKNKPIELIYSSLFNKTSLSEALKGVDYVYNVAGITFAIKKEEYYEANCTTTNNLIEVCYKEIPDLKKFVHISSQAAVGPAYDEATPTDENTNYHPITTYGKSKMKAELVVRNFFDKMRCTIVRPPSVYGPRDIAILTYFKTANKGILPIIGFNNKLISLIHCYDLVRGIIMAGESENAASNIYFISSKKFYTWQEIGAVTSKLLNKKLFKIRIPHFFAYAVGLSAELYEIISRKPAILNLEKCRDVVQSYWICSTKKAENELGFKETITLEEGFKNTIEWYKQMGWLKV